MLLFSTAIGSLIYRLKQSYSLLPKQKVFIKIQRYSDDNSSRPPWHLNLVGKGDKGYKKKFICLWMSRLDRGTNKSLSVDPKGSGWRDATSNDAT